MSQGRATIPNVIDSVLVTDDKRMSDDFQSFLMQLILYMQTYLSNEGYVAPPLTTAQINSLTNALNGTIVYNTTTQKLMGKENGAFANLI